VEKYCRSGQATDENTVRAHYALHTYGNAHTRTLRIFDTYRKQANIQKYAVQHTPCPVTQCFAVRTSHRQAFSISFLQLKKNIATIDHATKTVVSSWHQQIQEFKNKVLKCNTSIRSNG
jgi:hypothetical protein